MIMARNGLFIALVALLAVSCSRDSTWDVSSSDNFGTIAHSAWKTKVTLSVESFASVEDAPVEVDKDMERTTDPAMKQRILPTGTIIRIERLMVRNYEVGELYVEVSVQSGSMKGKTFRAPTNFFAPNRYLRAGYPPLADTWSVAPDKLEAP